MISGVGSPRLFGEVHGIKMFVQGRLVHVFRHDIRGVINPGNLDQFEILATYLILHPKIAHCQMSHLA